MSRNYEIDDIFSHLNSEHQCISEFLNYFEKINWMIFHGNIPDEKLIKDSFYFIQNYIKGFHHSKEEELLFPEAFRNKIEKNGGSECTKFFQHYLDNQYCEKFDEYRKIYRIPTYKPTEFIQSIINANSPLAIPLSEHEAGHYAVQIMIILWEQISTGELEKTKEFSKIGRWYLDMLRFHIKKEENCLFVSLKRTLSREQIKTLSESSVSINEKFSKKSNDILEIMDDLKNRTRD